MRDETDEARLLIEMNKDGYFTNEHLLKQVAKTVDIFEKTHTASFFFWQTMHRTYVVVGNSQEWEIWSGGETQKLVDDNGIPKGMRVVLQERGIDTTGIKAIKMCDFKTQKLH